MATESQTGRFVAVKIITDGVSPPVKLSRVEDKSRELDIRRRLRRNPHPNIVELLDHAEYPTEPHPTLLVLEFAAHGTLLEYYSRSLDSLPCNKEQTAKEITLQIIKATKHLHDMNIIHGDISPSNVLVFEFDDSDITPYCKLADFTHAQDFIIGNRPGGPDCFVQGTPAYMSLECLKGLRQPSAGECLSDVWFTEFVPRLRLPSAAELFEPLDLRALVGNDGKAKDSDTHGKAYPMCNIVGYLGESFIASLGRDFPRQDWPDLLRADSSTVFLPSTEAQTTRCCSCEPSDEPVSQTVTRMHHQWGRQMSPDELARALQSVPEGHEP
ncbi:Serine/threonine-protein kinase dclk2 [Friedmanniomyces endolithicus]|uniref:EKC/KEOPS complex subunit BUD32 n=1 Tax=Rachicladosporium monterosium TaxID=1507873 RepID=A0ABR0KZF9_9PEZI|nr:Serine/threonine-protein kinase dclk2 [Friedmanniomyces endolithicus]KAK5141102.1 hypothetical protein LTR32_006259 [Rachicladosporium monterosium]